MRASPVFLCLTALAAAGCAAPTTPKGVVYDLAERALAADRDGPWTLILFGTPAALPHQAAGFLPGAAGPTGGAWLRPVAEILLPDSTAPRRAVLDLEMPQGAGEQALDVALGGVFSRELLLRAGRRRYLLDLPASPASSRLRLAFKRKLTRRDAAGGRVAATLHALCLGPADDAALQASASDSAPPFLDVSHPGAVRVAAPIALRYLVALPHGAELRFRAEGGTPGAPADLAVRMNGRVIWTGRGSEGAGREVALPLSGKAGSIAAVELVLGPARGPLPVRGAWISPRILGTPSREPSQPAPGSGREADARRLREALAQANVVLVVLDAASALRFGCYGYARPTTPEIDRLAAEGVLFENAYTPAVSTLAAMTSLWTSLPPDRHQNLNLRRRHLQEDRLTLLPERLAASGIHTAGFVANGVAGPAFGFDRGFDEFHELYTSRTDAPRADAFREVLHPWLRANRGRRFFAYVHFREPHFPYDPPPPFDRAFGPDAPIPRPMRSEPDLLLTLLHRKRRPAPGEIEHLGRLYDGNLAFADQEVGRLRQVLEREGLLERTLVLVTSDHGEALFEHGHIGHEVLVYEEEVRVPLILRFPRPAGVAPRRVTQGFFDLLDVAPTLAEVFGISPEPSSFHGRSLLSAAAGAPGKAAVHFRDVGERPWFGFREDRRTCLYDSGRGVVELYDVVADPGQRRDLAPAEPLAASACRQSLHAWLLEQRSAGGARGLEGPDAPALSREQLENLKSLGYVN